MKNSNIVSLISLGEFFFKVINLTEPLRMDVEVFPGNPQPKKETFRTYKENYSRYHIYSIGDHIFHPHGDAPKHMNEKLKNRGFEYWGPDYVFNKACMIDLSKHEDVIEENGIRYLRNISKIHLIPYIDRIKNMGAIVIRTGYDKIVQKNQKHARRKIPFFDKSAVDFLLKYSKCNVIGTDSMTIDGPGEKYAHKKFSEKLIVESIVNLSHIPKLNRFNFDLQTSPISIIGATGGPVLAYAYIAV
jgi:kynurenine formamidase